MIKSQVNISILDEYTASTLYFTLMIPNDGNLKDFKEKWNQKVIEFRSLQEDRFLQFEYLTSKLLRYFKEDGYDFILLNILELYQAGPEFGDWQDKSED